MNRWPNLSVMTPEDFLSTEDPLDVASKRSLVPLEKPKRPLSSYNLFFKNERLKLLDELPAPPPGKKPKHSHGKLNFEGMAKIIGQRWRKVDPVTKARFEHLALDDRIRYERAMKIYREAEERQQERDIMRMRLEPRPLPPNHEHDMTPIPFDYRASIADITNELDNDSIDCIIQTFLC